MNLIIVSLSLILLLLPFHCKNIINDKNILFREIEEDKERELSSNQDKGIYFIKDELSLYHKNDYSLFVSIIDCQLSNKLSFPSTISDYSMKYNLLLGETNSYYPMDSLRKKRAKHFDHIHNTTNESKLYDEVHLRTASFFYNDTIPIDLYLLRNQFVTQFNLTKSSDNAQTNMKFLDFYDLNIVTNHQESHIDFNDKANAIMINEYQKDSIEEKDIIDNLTLLSYDIIMKHSLIQLKVRRMKDINTVLLPLLNRQEIHLNLYNFLLSPQIKEIKVLMENLEKTLISLTYYPLQSTDDLFKLKLATLTYRINQVLSFLDKFDFSSSDKGLFISYYLFVLLLILIGGYFIMLTISEFKIAYAKKVK